MRTETPTPEQIAKLPKWAQEYLEDQVRIATRCQSQLSQLQELLDNATPSDCWLSVNFGRKFYLPSDRITFALGDGCELGVHIADGRLKIM